MKFDKIFRNRRAINGFPTTNGQVRSSAIHRTFRHYTDLKNQYLLGKCVLSAVLFLLIAGALLIAPQAAFAQATISSIAFTSDPGADKTYIFGEKVQATVTFSKAVTVTEGANGPPELELKFDYGTGQAKYKSGSTTTALVFEYTLQQNDAKNGIAIQANKLTLPQGTVIRDPLMNVSLNHSAVAADSNHKVDASQPFILSNFTNEKYGITITSTPTSNNTYLKNEKIQVQVEYTEKVLVTGTPRVALTIGANTRYATYTSGNNTKKIIFEYKVATGDTDTDGIAFPTSVLSLNGGTMKDAPGNNAELSGYQTHVTTAQSSHKVDSSSAIGPTISSIAFTSTATNSTYKIGDKIQATVTFNKSVTADTTGGTPKLTLKIGSSNKDASYKSGSPGTALVFEYTVASGDEDTNGIEIEANKLSLNSGTIVETSDSTINAILTHTAVAASTSHKVDAVAPTVATTNGVAITSTAKTYKIDDKIQVAVTFTENVTVTGTPQVELTIGTASKKASYTTTGSTTTKLVFEYTVVIGDEDTDGISIAANSLSLNSGTIVDSVGNAATLTHTALGTQSSHKVAANVPNVTDIDVGSSASNSTYSIGTTLQVWATFNKNVTVTGTPQLTVTIGSASKDASYVRTLNNVTLVFEYTIAEGDEDTDGISVAANSLKLNSGTITDATNVSKNALLTHDALATQSDHKVDGVKPTIKSFSMHSTPAKGTTYLGGEDIEVKVTFTKDMRTYTTGGKPQLTLKIGTADKIAPYSGGFGTPNVRFKYRVAAGDVDTDGISIDADSLELNGGSIESWTGNDATLTHTAVSAFSGHKVDAVVPVVSSLAFTSTPASSNTYAIGEKIQITATFNKNVTVTGIPKVTLKLGAGNRTATYASGSGTQSLVFEYTVVSHDEDTDGVAIEMNKLSVGTGTIRDANDTNAVLAHAAVAASTSHKVDGIAPRFDGSGSSTGIHLTSSGIYGVGKKITLTFQFTEKVKVTGTPQLAFTINAVIKSADYKSGADTNTLTFEYTVVAGDSGQGILVPANSLTLNGGTIKDFVGNAAVLTHRKSVNWIHQKVDTTAPTVSSVTMSSTAQTYGVGDKIQATVTFSEILAVTGTPQLTLKIGSTDKVVNMTRYEDVNSVTVLRFDYTVVAGDNDTDGVEIEANKLSLNGGTIKDRAANDATLTHTALPAQASHIVDTTGPTVATNGIAFTSTPKRLNTYAAGETVQATVAFDEVVYVTGTPQLTVQIGAFPVVADWTSGSGTKSLVFETTAQAGHEDTDGIEVKANKLSLNGGTIKDGVRNAATLTHAALTAQSSHKVDGQSPIITSGGVSIQTDPTKNNTYKKGEKIRVAVTFNDYVYVTGTPTLALTIGTKKQNANYTRGSGKKILHFEYTVVEGDSDTDGVSIQNNALKGGTITDNVGNPALVVLTALATQAFHKVDGVSPKVIANGIEVTSTPATGAASDTYIEEEDIQITVEFDDTVYVVGTPKLTVEMGSTDTDFNYLSGSETKKLIFQHTVDAGDEDTDGIGVEVNKLKLGSQTVTIKDDIGNNAILTHAALVTQPAHKVDAIKPTVNTDGISITSNAGADRVYVAGDKIEVQVTFSENVTVTGSPQLPVTIGTKSKNADYDSGTSTAKIKFVYTVVAGDEDTDGISIAENKLNLNDGTIKDRAGNAAVLMHAALPAQAWHKVGAAGPGVTDIAITSTSGNNYYKEGAKIQVTATFNENVTVTGTPTLTITVGTHYKKAVYTSGSGSKKLVFEYTVATGDVDTDGVSVAANQIVLPNGVTIKDSNGNNATLTHPEISNAPTHKVDAKDPTVVLNGVSITSTSAPYGIGEKIQATVTFSESVVVTNTPLLAVEIGSKTHKTRYASGTGTTKLVFEYTVASGDTDADGVEILKDSIGLNGGTINDAAGNTAVLKHTALSAQSGHKVDGVPPTIVTDGVTISSGAGTDKTYKTGDKIEATVRFSETVNVTGTPQVTLTIGSASKKANYKSGSGTTDLAFEYTVVAGDEDTGGISIGASKLSLNSGTIKDAAGNTATLTHAALATQASHKVDAVAPTVSSVAITSSPSNNGFYKVGENIQATVTFSENVTVTGTPQLTLTIGTANKNANYASGDDTKKLVFSYAVAAGDEDTDGISIAANQLALNGGTIKDVVGNEAALGHAAAAAQGAQGQIAAQGAQGAFGAQAEGAFGAQANFGLRSASLVTQQSGSGSHKVDGVKPTISSLAITSSPTNGSYVGGEKIQATVTFSETVKVTGAPQLKLNIGGTDKTANYKTGSNTKLIFEYTVTTTDNDNDGISIGVNKLDNSGTIKDIANNEATRTHDALDAQSAHKVGSEHQNNSGSVPTVSSVSLTSIASNYYYKTGNKVQATVRFSESVTVTGTPQLILRIGSTDKTANYKSGSGSSDLVFEYTVASGDTDTDGISIAQNQLKLNSGTIKNTASNDATLTHGPLAAQSAHRVDTTAPTIPTNGIAITSPAKTYKANDTITATVTFSENVNVSGRPRLFLMIGTAKREASYTGGTGTTALNFQYTVVTGDKDTDGISIAANTLELSDSTITDTAGNAATLTHAALDTQTQYKVDTTTIDPIDPSVQAPEVGSLSLTSTGPYRVGSSIEVTVYTDQTIRVTGTPTLTLTIGSTDRMARYTRGSGSFALVFSYTVVAGDTDTDGVAVKANSLTGGTLKNSNSKDLVRTHSAITNAGTSHAVDTTRPTVKTDNGVAITSTPNNNTYNTGDTIEVTVRFGEIVNVTGTPRLTLTIGSAGKHATYTNGSGTATLNFQYTVAAGNTDTDGISIGANTLETNGGTLTDAAGNAADLTHTALPPQTAHKVETINNFASDPGQTATPGGSVEITSTGPYGVGSKIEVTVFTNERIYIRNSKGKEATLTLVVGTTEKTAKYIHGNGSFALRFSYTVVAGDTDTDGVAVKANSLTAAGGLFIGMSNDKVLDLAHRGTNAGTSHAVDTTPPAVNADGLAITSTTDNHYYQQGEKLQVTATFNEHVIVTGTPTLTLTIGTSNGIANWISRTGTTPLVFEYTIAKGDEDTDGVSITADQLSLNGGTITDAAGNAAVLTHAPLTTQANHRVDTIIPVINRVAITSTPSNGSAYKQGENIQATVTFSENVTVTGTPQLSLLIGRVYQNANWISGSGTKALVFEYTVAKEDVDTNGVSIVENQLSLNGGTITDAAGNAAVLTHAPLTTQTNHKVDGIAPIITGIAISSTPSNNIAYKQGENIQAMITFSENVTVTGTPQLSLLIGRVYQNANWTSGSGTKTLVFEYTIAKGDEDTDGVSIAENQLSLKGGTITDAAGNAAVLTHAALTTQTNHKVDTIIPVINRVAITSTPSNGSAYKQGENIQATITFSENVTVAGTPQLALTIGAVDRRANWTSGSGTKTLVFEYTIAPGDTDTDGVSIAENQLSLNGGTITDAAGNAAVLTHAPLTTQTNHKVDTIIPVINRVAITSTPSNGSAYKQGENIQATITFSENVTVAGTPQLALTIGAVDRRANWTSGSGTKTLVFEYTIAPGDTDTDGASIAANQLFHNGGTITDTVGNTATLTHAALTTQANHKVDGIAPIVSRIAITSTPSNGSAYKAGEKVQATVTFSENVTVTDTPQLTLRVGAADRHANWISGSGTKNLIFEYTVAKEDVDTDGVSIAENQLSLNGGTLTDAAGNAAVLTHNALTTQANHVISQPTISSLAITSTGPYGIGSNIEVTVSTSEAIYVTGIPTLTLGIGATDRMASYIRGNGSSGLVFSYTVVAGDTDTNGVGVKANSLTLNGGTLKNGANANLQLTHSEIANVGISHAVDTTPPVVNANGLTITSTSGNHYYQQGATLQVIVTFNERVIVTGTPILTLTIGMGKNATYTRGSGTKDLVFEYTIAPGDTDTDGVSIAANQLSLNGGTLTDAAGNAAVLTHAPLTTQANHKVDGIAPIITGIEIISTPSKDGTYKQGEKVQARVTFNENVTVLDTPQLPLKIGTVYQNANWISGSGTKALVFEYTVAIGDEDTDGISIEANGLTSNGGSITDAAGNAAILTHTALNTQVSHKVGGPPVPSFQTVISSLFLTSTGPYRVGSSIEVTVSTNVPIYVTGTPSVTLLVGTTEKTAEYAGGNGSATLVFTYTVVAGDEDTDGVGVKVNSLFLNGGTLKDSSDNDLVLTHSAVINTGTSHAVDTTPLEVDSVAITSMGPYGVWDNIEVTLTTTKPVIVTGSATVSFIIGNREKRASYHRGSQTNVLVFQYTVALGDGEDPDGISVKANSLSLNGGTILDALGNSLNLNHEALPNGGEEQRVDTTAPQVSSLAITSTGPYGVWDNTEVTLTTTKPVIVTGSATVSFIIGNREKRASYQRGSRTNTLVFQYTVASGDGEDPDGISVRANSLSLNGGTILDKLGNNLNLNHEALQNAGRDHRVDATPPQISDIAITSTGPYTVDDDIQVTVTTNEAVTATGNPTLGVVIGNTERKAVLFSGKGTSALGFRYKVTAADKDDTNGISVKANALRTNEGTITDSVGNALNLNHSHIANAGETQIVGTTVSSIHSVALTSQGPYKVNDTINVTIATTEKVNVTGTPRIPIKLGMATKYADYVSGSGTTSLVFEYTVVTGDTDTDGIEITQNALENYSGSIIKNIYQTDLDLRHNRVAADATQKVDTTEWRDTALFTNYPNPFNPETWIPYQLGTAADVTVRIYAATGHLVRTLALGHKAPGIYKRRGEAAYWDGKNELGEPAASGVYFFTLTAGDFTGTRKMIILR